MLKTNSSSACMLIEWMKLTPNPLHPRQRVEGVGGSMTSDKKHLNSFFSGL
jgi:hypothetical protein